MENFSNRHARRNQRHLHNIGSLRRSNPTGSFWYRVGRKIIRIFRNVVLALVALVVLLLVLSLFVGFAPQMRDFLLLFIQGFGFVVGALYAMVVVMLTNPCLLVFFIAGLALLAWWVGRRSRW
jgi:hypothetical protein